jgi:D-alanyl-D-alanine carboxypeptidase
MHRRLVAALVGCLALTLIPAGTAAAEGHGHGEDQGHGSRRPFPAPVAAKLQQALAAARQGYAVPGMAVAVHEPGVGDLHVTAGSADIASKTPITPATHFRIGSVTKTFTATVILQLVQEHRLSLSTDVDRWFPQLPYAERITIRDLLDMHSGIFDEGGGGSSLAVAANAHPTASWTPAQIVAFAIKDGSKPPGVTFSYSDTNYVMLGAIAEAVTHTRFDRLLARRILRPLHLEHTSFPTTSLAMPSPAATAYQVGLPGGNPAHPEVVVAQTLNPSVLAGAGAMISTLPDMERWARALGTGELLTPKLQRLRLDLMASSFTFGGLPGVANPNSYPAGYGLGIIGVDNFLGHNGIVNGFTSDVWFDPSSGATIVVLFNSEIFVTSKGVATSFLPISDGLFTTVAEILQGQV